MDNNNQVNEDKNDVFSLSSSSSAVMATTTTTTISTNTNIISSSAKAISNKPLFQDIKFIIAQCNEHDTIKTKLLENGAKLINYLSEHVTLVIADVNCPEAEEAVDLFDKPVVNSLWVHLSIKVNKLLPMEAFSPIKQNLFNNYSNISIQNSIIVSFSSKLTKNDIEVLASTLTFYGARVSKDISNSTHFIVASADDIDDSFRQKYLPQSIPSDVVDSTPRLKIVTPDWVVESVKAEQCCDEQLFDPSLLLPPPPPTPPPPVQKVNVEMIIDVKSSNTEVKQSLNESTNVQKLKIDNLSEQQQQQQQQLLAQRQTQMQSPMINTGQQLHQPSQQNMQTLPPSQLPRATRMPSQIIRGVQPKFRAQLPPNNNVQILHRPPQPTQGPPLVMSQPNRLITPDSQQPKKVTINYGQYRKPGPFQNNIDPNKQPHHQQQQHMQQNQIQPQQHQQQPYVQVQHSPMMQTQVPVVQQSRLPQPNMYHQVRGPYQQGNHINPRMPAQQQQQIKMSQQQIPSQQISHPTANIPPHQQSHQPNQMINRFQEPGTHLNQRPYQICLQPQVQPQQQIQTHIQQQTPPQLQPQPQQSQNLNSNYSSNMVHRQPIYYSQGPNQIQTRVPNQGQQVVRPIHGDQQIVYKNYNSTPQTNQDLVDGNQHSNLQQQQQTQQYNYQQSFQPQAQNQQQISTASQHVPTMVPQQQMHMQPQQPLTNPIAVAGNVGPSIRPSNVPLGSNQIRPIRNLSSSQMEPRGPSDIRFNQNMSQHQNNPQQNPRMGTNVINQPPPPQPHPSIFDHTQESNLAQIKAKVPIVIESIDYFGHDPKENVPKGTPFIGCRFMFVDYEHISVEKKDKWTDAIKAAGGTFVEDLKDLTHLICENILSDQFKEALDLGVRCVTIYWINDVLANDHLSYPWKALHLPVSFTKSNRPLSDHIISVTNLKGRERREVKDMIIMTGAKYTEYFSPSNTLIICGNVGGDKYEHAVEWKTPIANCQIISDILLNSNKDIKTMLSQTKYQLFNRADHLKLLSYADVRKLMKPWTRPIIVDNQRSMTNGTAKKLAITLNTNDDSGLATGGSNNSDSDIVNGKTDTIDSDPSSKEDESESKIIKDIKLEKIEIGEGKFENIKIDLDIKDEKPNEYKPEKMEVDTMKTCKIETSNEEKVALNESNNIQDENQSKSLIEVKSNNSKKRSLRKSTEPVRLLFTHLNSNLVSDLRLKALKLGLGFASSPINCTHLIVDRISRTPKFVCAFSHAKYILSYNWIVDSHEANSVLDEKHFILHDKLGEEKYSFNLLYSWFKRRKRNGLLFKNMIFFVTPTVKSNVSNVKEMIESAGGVVATKKPPTRMQLDQLRADGKLFVVVSCKHDSDIYSILESYGVDIVDVEFVLSGILRQDIDFDAHRLNQSMQSATNKQDIEGPMIVAQSPSKKLRLEDNIC